MKRLSKADINLNKNVYKNFLEMGVDDGWTSKDKLINFEQFLKICEYTNLPITEASVLDVGSGTGDFGYYLNKMHVKKYVGVEIYEPAVDKAKMKYPEYEFIVGDFLEIDLPKFDFVYSSGSTTAQLNTDNYVVLKHWIKKMWGLCNYGIVFNVLLERYPNESNDEHLFLYDRLKVMELAAKTIPKSQMKVLVDDAGCGDGTEELHVYMYK